ncbi:MAG: VWA domain-containing protein [Sulfuritalea sp.]|nr:VWA domain-containing protein [Sulfuritalea sp.]
MSNLARTSSKPAEWSIQRAVGERWGEFAAKQLGLRLDRIAEQAGLHIAEQLDQALPRIIHRDGTEQHFHDLLDLLEELPALGSGEAAGLAGSLAYLAEHLDVPGLRRWTVTGLRAYGQHPAKMLAYFRLDDPLAARSLAHEQANVRFATLHNLLQYYVDGLLGDHLGLSSCGQGALHGPPLRSVVTEGGLFLPEGYSVLDGADGSALYRAAAAHAVAHLKFSPQKLPAAGLKPMLLAVIALIEDARVEYLMMRELPGLHALWSRFHQAAADADGLSFAGLGCRLALALHDPDREDDNYWVNKGVRLFREQLSEPGDYAAFRRIASILANDLGQMRVRFSAESYVPAPAYRDDNSFLWDYGESQAPPPQQEPLQLDTARMERDEKDQQTGHGDQPQAPPASVSPLQVQVRFEYPEWDYQSAVERDAWTTVIEQPLAVKATMSLAPPVSAPQSHRNLFSMIKARQLSRSTKLTRQWEGEELDLNAAVAARVDMRSGLPPDPRVFKRPGRRLIESAILVLLDISESTNDCLPGRFESLLDAIKSATLNLGTAMDEAKQKFAIHAFCSNGRQEVSYYRLKDFDETFGGVEQTRVRALRGSCSTRMGTALRHAQAMLAEQAFERKILLLVTDGEPSDVDVGDANYLIEDTARAVRVIHGAGTIPFCLTVDKKAERYVAQIFGDRYLLLENPQDLVAQLSHVFVRLLSR